MHKNRTGNGLRLEQEHQERYEKWWLNKQCKYGKITKVEYIGNSVYGFVYITTEDGKQHSVSGGFRPRKSDLEIFAPKNITE